MVEGKENRTKSLTVRENENPTEEMRKTVEKEAVLLQNATRKKSASQKRRKVSNEANRVADNAELKEQSAEMEIESADNMLLDSMESLSVCEDGQEAPLSFKMLFKAVKTFSKRKPKNPKTREVARERKETDVVVFERLATPRSFYKPHRMSRALPPIMDIHDLLSTETQVKTQVEEEKQETYVNCLRSDDAFGASITEETQSALRTSEQPDNQPPAGVKREFRRHRCSGFLHELEADGLQEFGSFDVSIGNRDRGHRRKRASLGYLCNTYEEQEALHF